MRSVSRFSVATWSTLSCFLLLTALSTSTVMAAQDALICPADRINSNGNICTAADVSLAAAAVAVSQTGLTCAPGETIDVAIAGTVNLRKGDRFDIGVWVSTDGKPMDVRGGSGAGIPDEGGAQNCEVLPLPSQLIAKDGAPGVFVIDSFDDAATPQDCYDTKAANNGDISTGFALTSERDSIINGFVDSSNDGVIDASDTTTLLKVFGVHIISGGVDIDDSGVIDASDDGVWNGYAVQDGVIDVDGDGNFGEVDGTDDSDQSFNDLITMLCVAGPTGQLALETLVSWHVPSDAANVCTPTDPDTYGDFTQQGDPVMSSSKCSVSSSEVDVQIVGKVTILKSAPTAQEGELFEFSFTNSNPTFADTDPNIPDLSPSSPFNLADTDSDEIFAVIGDRDGINGPFIPAIVEITESNLPAGWQLSDLVCTGDDLVATTIDLGTNTATVTLLYNDLDPLLSQKDVTCTFTNAPEPATITVVKMASGGDSAFDFDWSSTSNPSPNAFQLTTVGGMVTSDPIVITTGLGETDFQVVETLPLPTGWEFGTASCIDELDQPIGTPGGLGVSGITLDAGDDITCTFMNTKQGTVNIVKQTVGAVGATFGFTTTLTGNPTFSLMTGGGGLSAPETRSVSAGQYTVEETSMPAGWRFTEITCDDDDSTSSGTVLTLNVEDGETITCTYVNTLDGQIIVDKVTNPAGSSQEFTFTPSWGADFPLADGTTPMNSGFLLPGPGYNVSETVPTGWDLTDTTCTGVPGDIDYASDAIDLSPGEVVTCVFTNTQRGSIEIVKELTALGPASQTFSFTGTGPGGFDFGGGFTLTPTDAGPGGADTTAPDDYINLLSGSYTLAEANPVAAGWVQVGASCTGGDTPDAIDVSPGEAVVCTFTNAPLGSSTVTKVSVGGEGQFDFTWGTVDNTSVPEGEAALFPLDTTGDGTESMDFSYKLLTGDTEFDPGLNDSDATIVAGANETVTCTFTNTLDGTLVIRKQTENPENFDQDFDFVGGVADTVGDVAGTINDFDIDPIGGELSLTAPPGVFGSAEAIPTGWAITNIACVGQTENSQVEIGTPEDNFTTPTYVQGDDRVRVNVGAGETVICTFTNQPFGSLTIIKNMVGADDTTFNFLGVDNVTDPAIVVDFAIDTAGVDPDQKQFTGLPPGMYGVAEILLPGYDLSNIVCTGATDSTITIGDAGGFDPGDSSATVEMLNGEDIICTFTNTQQGNILVDKVTDPTGSVQSFDFTSNYGNPFTLTDADVANDSGLLPASSVGGTYSVSEAVTAGWDQTSATCTGDGNTSASITLLPGETVICTFVNTQRPIINLAKTVNGPATLEGDGTYTVVYTITASNMGGPGTYDLVDTFSPGAGISLNTATVDYLAGTENSQTGALAAYPNFVTGEALAEGLNESWTVTANFTVDPAAVDPQSSLCDPGVPVINTGFYNAVAGSATDTDLSDNDTCTGLPQPGINLAKTVNGPAVLQGDGTYTVEYTIAATNTGGPGVYDLVDTFSPGAGITLNTASAVYVAGTENSQTGALAAYPNFVTGEALADGLNESWTVTANFTVDPALVDPQTSQCDPAAPVINTGFYNAVAGSDTDTDLTDNETCTGLPFAVLTLMKRVNGGSALPADFALTLTGIDGTHDSGVDYMSGDTPTVQVGVAYTLSELADQVPDYVDGGVVCTDDSDSSQLAHPVTLSAGQSATCTQTNTFTLPPGETIPVPVNDRLALLLLTMMMLVSGWYFRPAVMRKF